LRRIHIGTAFLKHDSGRTRKQGRTIHCDEKGSNDAFRLLSLDRTLSTTADKGAQSNKILKTKREHAQFQPNSQTVKPSHPRVPSPFLFYPLSKGFSKENGICVYSVVSIPQYAMSEGNISIVPTWIFTRLPITNHGSSSLRGGLCMDGR